jgi:ribosomal protein L11 methyltransferase
MTDSIKQESKTMTGDPLHHRKARFWNKVTIMADSRMTEAISAYLADLSSGGIEIMPAENPNHEKFIAYLPEQFGENGATDALLSNLKSFMNSLVEIFPECSAPQINSELIKEEDWGKAWKSFFRSFQITAHLTIKPSWEEPVSGPEEKENHFVIEMDPGLAFGTGHHASTKLTLCFLEELFLVEKVSFTNVLDLGTGSGILAMACGLFGAKKVQAIDNDPDAVETARANIERNQLGHIIEVSGEDFSSLEPAFDLIVANIIHETLAEMAENLVQLLAPEGYLVLSGILKGKQQESICKIYTSRGMDLIKVLIEDEWASLLFRKIDKFNR